jgi:O-succinylbenzoate synthase
MTGLTGIELRELDLALAAEVGTATGVHRTRPLLLARVVTTDGEGWGECGALGEGTSVDPPIGDVRPVAEGMAGALVERGDCVLPPFAETAGAASRMARAMFEMGFLDALLTASAQSLGAHLGGDRTAVPVGAVVGIPSARDTDRLLAMAEVALGAAAGGAQRLRIKIAPGWDVAPVRAIRTEYPDLTLQVDANGTYREVAGSADGADALERLEEFDVACIEQPLPPGELEAHARLAATLRSPIALDESLASVAQVDAALALGAMTVACLKPSRLGGFDAALEAQERCAAAGCHAFVGGFFESGLARCANVAVASRRGFDLPGDLTSPVGYLSAQPFDFPEVRNGSVAVPTEPGVGSTARREVIDRLTVWQRWIGGRGT